MVAMSTPSTLSQACSAWPVSASGSPLAKPSTATTSRRYSAPGVRAWGWARDIGRILGSRPASTAWWRYVGWRTDGQPHSRYTG